jgi:hypothetical protein
MLTASIFPSPNLEPAEAVAFYLSNPLLLAAYPTAIAQRVEQVAAEQFTGPALHKLAVDLYTERNRLRLKGPVEPDAVEAEKDLRQLLQSRHLTSDERKDLSKWLHTARPSEYDWLRKPIEAAIQRRAEADMLKIARVARLTNTPIVPASQLAA